MSHETCINMDLPLFDSDLDLALGSYELFHHSLVRVADNLDSRMDCGTLTI